MEQPIRLKGRGPARRRWYAIPAVVAGVLALGIALLYFAGRPIVLGQARAELDRKIGEVSEALGREIKVGDLSASFFDDIVVEDIQVPAKTGMRPVLRIGRVVLGFSLWDVLTGNRVPRHVAIEDVDFAAVLEGQSAPDLADLAQGMERYTKGRGGGGGGGAGRKPDVVVLSRAGIRLFRPGQVEPFAEVRDVTVAAKFVDGARVEADLGGVLKGFGDRAIPFKGRAEVGGDRSVRLDVNADRAVSLASLAAPDLPVAVSATGLSIAAGEGRLGVAIRSASVADSTPLLARLPQAQEVKAGGPMAADEVRVEITGGLDGLKTAIAAKKLDLSMLSSASVRRASGQLTLAKRPAWPLVASGLDIDVERGRTGDLEVKVKGQVEVRERAAAKIEASGQISPEGDVRVVKARLGGPLPVHILSSFHPRLLAWPGAALDADVTLRGEGDRLVASGHIEGTGLAYFWTKLCLVPITDLAFQADFEASLSMARQTLYFKAEPIVVGTAKFTAELDVTRFKREPKVRARVTIPMQDCQAIARAVPPVMVPRLEGAVFDGQMRLEVKVAVDAKNLYGSSIEVDVNAEDCRAVSLGPAIDIEALNGEYLHRVVEDDADEPISVGPGTVSYVGIENIPDHVQQAALATEDMAFFKHKGFKLGLIKRAMVMNLDKGWYVYGGSTISQQLVKNLFLSREKTLARKLEEAVVVWAMERRLTKERILELYLNCIEFGRHIYGIKAAARTYFDKSPSELTPLESAFIMATKPGPRYAHNVYRKGVFTQWWVDRMDGILKRLWQEMNVIDETAYREAAPYLPEFWYPEEGVHRRPEVEAGVVVPPGMPKELPKEDKAAPAPVPAPEKPGGDAAAGGGEKAVSPGATQEGEKKDDKAVKTPPVDPKMEWD